MLMHMRIRMPMQMTIPTCIHMSSLTLRHMSVYVPRSISRCIRAYAGHNYLRLYRTEPNYIGQSYIGHAYIPMSIPRPMPVSTQRRVRTSLAYPVFYTHVSIHMATHMSIHTATHVSIHTATSTTLSTSTDRELGAQCEQCWQVVVLADSSAGRQ